MAQLPLEELFSFTETSKLSNGSLVLQIEPSINIL